MVNFGSFGDRCFTGVGTGENEMNHSKSVCRMCASLMRKEGLNQI